MRILLCLAGILFGLVVIHSETAKVGVHQDVFAQSDLRNDCLRTFETSRSGDTVTYKIDQPVINKPYQCYDIPVGPGDRVTVSKVDGCVPTGGHGKTWKLYLNARGSSADRLYHGRIWVPGATAGLVRIASIYQQPLTVNKLPDYYDGVPPRIWLGFEDQKYTDNDYVKDKPDNGTGNQCKDQPKAHVEIQVTPASTGAASGKVQPYPVPAPPYDLDWDEMDANLLPLNPFWHAQRSNLNLLPDIGPACNYFHNERDVPRINKDACTQWSVDIDEGWLGTANCKIDIPRVGGLFRRLLTRGLVAGHINWGIVTYEGKIHFWDYEKFPLDRDYDLYLTRDDRRGLTMFNEYKPNKTTAIMGMGLEFYAHETLSRFKEETWWREFARAISKGNPFIGSPFSQRQGSYDLATGMVDGQDAIVIGLFGIDNEHHSHTEIHPVMGLAIRVDKGGDDSADQRWAIFASNWGTEGDCSNRTNFTGHYEHYLGRDQVSFFFHTPAGGQLTVDESRSKFFLAHNSRTEGGASSRYTTRVVPGGVIVTFYPGTPSSEGKPKLDPVVYGELWLKKSS